MLWFLLSLGAAFCWSIAQILFKKGLQDIPPLWGNIINNIISLFLWIPAAYFFSGSKINIPDTGTFLIITAAAIFYLSFLYALSKGKVSLVGTVVAVYPVWTILLSSLFINEKLTIVQILCITMIIISSIMISMPDNIKRYKNKSYNYEWIIWGFSASILIGTGDFLSKLAIERIGAFSYIIFLSIFSNIISPFNYLIDKKSRKIPSRDFKDYRFTILGSIVSLTGSFMFQLAFQHGKASLVTPVSSTYPAITVILAIKFLKEKIIKRQIIAIALTVISLIFMGFNTY